MQQRSHARLRADTERGVLRDAHGREVRLRGVNLGGRAKHPPFLPCDSEQDWEDVCGQLIARVASWGMNTLRLPLIWEAIEPEQGHYNTLYIKQVHHLLDLAHQHHLHVVLDLHQDVFSRHLGGSGAPLWAHPPELQRRASAPPSRLWFARYAMDAAVRESFEALWEDRHGALSAWRAMWQWVCARLADHPAVIGVELMNEPGWGNQAVEHFVEQTWRPICESLWDTLLASHPHLLLFYSSPGIHFMRPDEGAALPRRESVVFAPHLYDPGLLMFPEAGPLRPPHEPLRRLAALRDEQRVPVFIGEVGVTTNARGGAEWTRQLLDGLDQHGLSAAYWECSASSTLWNGEDLNLLDARGEERELVSVLARPWLSAVAGDEGIWAWDEPSQRGTGRWVSSGEEAWTRIALPHCWLTSALRVRCWGEDVVWRRTEREVEVSAPRGEVVEVEIDLA